MGKTLMMAVGEMFRGKVREWPRDDALHPGGANDWKHMEDMRFCLKNKKDGVVVSSYVREDRILQIMILEKGRVHGYDWDGREVRDAAEKIILKMNPTFPYDYRFGIEPDQKKLKEYDTFKEALDKKKSSRREL